MNAELRAKIDQAVDLRVYPLKSGQTMYYDAGFPGIRPGASSASRYLLLGSDRQQTMQVRDPKTIDPLDAMLAAEVVHVDGPTRATVPLDMTDKPDFLYWILFPTGEVKHGRSHDPRRRKAQYQTCFSTPLVFAALVKCDTRLAGEALETKMQRRYEVQGFRLTGGGDELFTQDILPRFKQGDLVNGYIIPRMLTEAQAA